METFDKDKRLLSSADYSFVFDKAGFKISHQHYLLLARRSMHGRARLGLVVAKKNVRLANKRNRIKRVVRETFRKQCQHLDSLDIIFLTRKGFDTLQPSLQTQLMVDAWKRLEKKLGDRS